MLSREDFDVINLWKRYYLKEGSSFWIYHKNGTMGRPYDAQYILDEIAAKGDSVEISYDKHRKVVINRPQQVDLSRDKVGNIRLEFSRFEFVEVILVDYEIDTPQAGDFRHIKTQSEGDELRLVGNSPNISDPFSIDDADYQALLMRARLVLGW